MGILDILFPKFCVSCKKAGAYLCSDCFSHLSFDTVLPCSQCNRPSFDGMTHPGCLKRYGLDGMVASVVYTPAVKKLIYQFKYQPYVSDLTAFLSQLFIEGIVQEEAFMHILSKDALFVPIPLHRSRLRKRGYNHAALLSERLSKSFGIPTRELLKRSKKTVSQFGLTREERKENLKDAFELLYEPQTPLIVLVDDIVTSGMTFSEAAKLLKRHGVEKVYGVALAHGK